MPTIKVTSEGKIILKDGKPSCTCCGPCSPDVMTVYVEYIEDPEGYPVTSYFELLGSLNDGLFGPDAGYSLEWDDGLAQWTFTDPAYGLGIGPGSSRCDPETYYSNDPVVQYYATVSFTPLP